jgi:hypothetical protein
LWETLITRQNVWQLRTCWPSRPNHPETLSRQPMTGLLESKLQEPGHTCCTVTPSLTAFQHRLTDASQPLRCDGFILSRITTLICAYFLIVARLQIRSCQMICDDLHPRPAFSLELRLSCYGQKGPTMRTERSATGAGELVRQQHQQGVNKVQLHCYLRQPMASLLSAAWRFRPLGLNSMMSSQDIGEVAVYTVAT